MTLGVDTPARDCEHPEMGHTPAPAWARGVARHEAAGVDPSVELLRTFADVLDIRTVFSRVSETANKMLPHDALVMAFVDHTGRIVRQAATREFPELPGSLRLTVPPGEAIIVEDLALEAMPVTEPAAVRTSLVRAGYRSVLSLGTQARDQGLTVWFVSKQPHGFSARDRLVAQQIVDHIALAVSHEQLADAARQIAD